MKTDLLFAVPEFLSNPYFSVGFFILMCVFAFLWAVSAHKASNSELDLSIRGVLMTEMQSKLNFVTSALELSKRNEKENEAVIKSLRADLSQEKAAFEAEQKRANNLVLSLNLCTEELEELKASCIRSAVSVPTPTEIKTPSEFKAAKIPVKRASKSTAKPKVATKVRSLGVED